MQFYKITDLKLEEPITILAKSHSNAANYFVACLHRGLGHVPIIEYKVDQCQREQVDVHADLSEIATEVQRALAWATEEGWEHVDPVNGLV